jgi:hypothetical protein
MLQRPIALGALIVCGLIATAPAATWNVPQQIDTIGGALTAAAAGDTILVAPGTYFEHHLVVPSGIVLRGVSGDPADVIIDAAEQGDVMMVPQGDASTLIEGLTLTGGSFGSGGGLHCGYPTTATFRRCVVYANVADNGGGGLACYGASPVFEECRFEDNYSRDDEVTGGGGVYLNSSHPVFRDCAFTSNSTAGMGGGVSMYASTATFERCTFSENQASNGAGVFVYHAEASFVDCLVTDNHGTGTSLGAIYAYASDVVMEQCELVANTAFTGAAVAGWSGSSITLDHCRIEQNQAHADLAAVRLAFDTTFEAVWTVFAANEGGDGNVAGGCQATLICCDTDPDAWIGDGGVIVDDSDCAVATRRAAWTDVRDLYR